MDINFRAYFIALSAAALAYLPADSSADSPAPPCSYVVEAEGGQFVFVMLAPMTLDYELSFCNEENGSKIRDIRQKYSASGLYSMWDATTPVWTVDWYAHSVLPFSDGIHLVREGPWAMSGRSEGVSFFASGELLRTYSVSDLVFATWLMPRSVSHFRWRKETSVGDDSLTYRLVTLHGERIVFNARTGDIVDSHAPVKWVFLALVGVLIMALRSIWKSWRRLLTIVKPTTSGRLRSAASILMGATATGTGFAIGLLLVLREIIHDDGLTDGAPGIIVTGAITGFLLGLLLAALRIVGFTKRKNTSEGP